MSDRLFLLALIYAMCANFMAMSLFLYRDRPDLRPVAVWPYVLAAVVATPFALWASS